MTEDIPQDQCTIAISDDDVLEAMKALQGFVDITPGDFQQLYRFAYRRAWERLNQSILAGQVMTRSVVSVTADMPLYRVAEELARHEISGVPVVDDEQKVVGVISEKDFLRAMTDVGRPSIMHVIETCLQRTKCSVGSLRKRRAGDLMSTPPITVGAEAPLAQIARLFQEHNINRVPITDDKQKLLGIMTRSDLVGAYCALQP